MTVVELRIPSPMLDLRLLHNRMFRQCNLVSLFSTASFLGVTFVMPLYLQLLRGMTPLASGLTTFPQAFGIMVSSVLAGRLYARIGPRRLMAGGFISAALTITLYTTLDLHTSLWLIRALMFGRGACMGFAFVPMQAASYATIDPSQNGRASSIFSTQRQVGVSIGVAIMASVLAAHMSLSRVPGADEVGRGTHRGSLGVRHRRCPGIDRRHCCVVHPRRGCRGDDGGQEAARLPRSEAALET